MDIYEKITRKLKNNNIDLKYILGKEKLRLINNGIKYAKDNSYDIGIEKLNLDNLKDFYENIYRDYIQKKDNPKICDLIGFYKDRLENGESIYLGYVKYLGNLVAGGIFLDKLRKEEGKVAMVGFRAYKDIKLQNLYMGYYIEYLFYKWALENDCERLSRGLDWNMYGSVGSNIGVALHKLQHKFLPYISKKSLKIEIDENDIKKETLIFTEADKDKIFRKAILWTDKNSEKIEKEFGIIIKREIKLEIRSITK